MRKPRLSRVTGFREGDYVVLTQDIDAVPLYPGEVFKKGWVGQLENFDRVIWSGTEKCEVWRIVFRIADPNCPNAEPAERRFYILHNVLDLHLHGDYRMPKIILPAVLSE